MMRNKILDILSHGFLRGHFIRIGDNRALSLYLGKDDEANYALEFRGTHQPARLSSSEVIRVYQGKDNNISVLRFSLGNSELLEYFCIFCQDLFDATKNIKTDTVAYNTLVARYIAWKKLFKPHAGRLSDIEIMGLLGELLFLQEYMIPLYGTTKAIDSWMGPEKAHKDFSVNNTWYEVKTIGNGKDSIHISSLEQLDSNSDGYLAVYCLEKMSPSFEGIKLNTLVGDIMNTLDSVALRENFLSKLSHYGFDVATEYDSHVYAKTTFAMYIVNDAFPRLQRCHLATAISQVQYDINISEINNFKL